MNVHSSSLSRYLNEEVEELLLANIISNIMENNVSNKIDNVVKKSVSADKDVIFMNIDVHDRSEPVNEGVTKDDDHGNMYLLNEDIMLKYLCQLRIDLERMLPTESLISEKYVQLVEEVIMKDNDNLEKALMYGVDLSDNMVEYVVHQMQFDLEDVGYLPKF